MAQREALPTDAAALTPERVASPIGAMALSDVADLMEAPATTGVDNTAHSEPWEPPLDEEMMLAPDPAEPQVSLSDFESVYGDYQRQLYTFLLRLTGEPERAADLCQDTFVKVYRALARTSIAVGALQTWLYRIAKRTAIDSFRHRKLLRLLPFSDLGDDQGVTMAAQGGRGNIGSTGFPQSAGGSQLLGVRAEGTFEDEIAEREVLITVLGRMKAMYRESLILREYHGLSTAEIGSLLHINPSAIKMRLIRARDEFARLYAQENEAEHHAGERLEAPLKRGRIGGMQAARTSARASSAATRTPADTPDEHRSDVTAELFYVVHGRWPVSSDDLQELL